MIISPRSYSRDAASAPDGDHGRHDEGYRQPSTQPAEAGPALVESFKHFTLRQVSGGVPREGPGPDQPQEHAYSECEAADDAGSGIARLFVRMWVVLFCIHPGSMPDQSGVGKPSALRRVEPPVRERAGRPVVIISCAVGKASASTTDSPDGQGEQQAN